MEKDSEKKKTIRRLNVLDGLRGFAIILVFLNHIDSSFIASSVPSFLRPVIYFLFTSGNLGVTFFFVLSGFLMGYLYANPQPKEFIERRYARIFPPFLVMVVCMWIFSLHPTTPLAGRIALILTVALVARFIWIHIIERFQLGSKLITTFLFLQCGIALWYGFFIMRRPPVWFDSLPFFLRSGTLLATNATLTLPLGNYIPLLDGVYWSLAPEVIFYLLYPYIFAPTVRQLQNKNLFFKSLFTFLLFPFFFGLSLVFRHSQGLTMLFIEYFIYFCGGIGVSILIRNQEKKKTTPYMGYFLNPTIFLILLFLSYFFLSKSTGYSTLFLRLFLVIPFGVIVYFLLTDESPLRSLFEQKAFLFLGTISYSLYIGHTAIIDGMHLLFRPYNTATNILFLVLTAIVFLLTATAMHYIIERPYFEFKPKKKLIVVIPQFTKVPVVFLFIFILFLFFSTYTSQYNFFSVQKKYPNIIPSTIAISDTPYTFSFVSQENQMGVLLVHLTNTVGAKHTTMVRIDPNKHQLFEIRIKEKGAKNWYASQDTSPAEIGNSSSYPFGFPPIVNSKGKTYTVALSMKDIDYTSTILFNKDTYPLTTVHQLPKLTILKSPTKLLSLMEGKLQTAFADPEAQLTTVCITPFFLLLFSL